MQVLVVRQDLKMGVGKIASQCARELFFSSVQLLSSVLPLTCFTNLNFGTHVMI